MTIIARFWPLAAGRARLGGLVCAFGVSVLSSSPLLAQGKPEALTLCHEDAVAFPLFFKDKDGYTPVLLKEIGGALGVPVKLVAKAWRDCLADVKAGTIDGAINASHSKERSDFADYPVNIYGDADASKRMHRSSYVLYRKKGTAVNFDGKAISGADGAIGAPTGYSVIAQLKQLNVKVDDSASASSEILGRVAEGKIAAAALISAEADDHLRRTAALQSVIERVPTALSERPYFTILSKKFTVQYPAFAKEFWRATGKVRASPEFQKKLADLGLLAE